MNLRALAAQTLTPVIREGKSLTPLFDVALAKLDNKERGLFQQLCFGCLRQFHQLQAISQKLLDKPLRNKDSDVFALLLLGLYQLIHLRTPDHAAISETVSATRQLKKPWASRLINGALRNFVRQRAEIEQQLADSAEYRFSHPQWLVDSLQEAWPEHYDAILEANNQQAPVCLRVNKTLCDLTQLQSDLQVQCQPLKYSADGLRLLESAEIPTLAGFAQGHFSVQDEAAQLAAQLLDLQPGQRVLDACAAPGGKSCHILEKEPNIAELLCIELEKARIPRIVENIERLGLKAPHRIVQAAAEDLHSWWDNTPFQRILLDAPCSATGVIRRHPDIKLLRQPGDLAKLSVLQGHILKTLWHTLAPGGLLVYATCSVLPAENELIIEAFLHQHSDARHLLITADWGETRPFGRQLFPQVGGHDGFYYACLQKAGA
ncbi:16S rRNA m(5)C-967 methyltransferase [Alteromonadaceae bacterium Bs31]|nr:16S rRNA m(5)C-967 methyltransferase [Alteromonadaceae bacterium Bs31]